MLEPLDRRHLFDALRPPPGYDVDVALGTTYSLDLTALLTVPLAFAMFEVEDDEGSAGPDPLALLEAVRRYADRLHIFCQTNRIYVPGRVSPLGFKLEKVVNQVRSPSGKGVFHPKVWLIRFTPVADSLPVRYRFLCLSRNLTFDRSWDTMLVLDGELADRTRAIAANHPLGDFIQALPGLMCQTPDRGLLDTLDRLQGEIRRTAFALPDGVERIEFHPLGLGGGSEDLLFSSRCDRMLACAPFVDGGFLQRLIHENEGRAVLISGMEQLAALNPTALAALEKAFYLNPDAGSESPEDEEGAASPADGAPRPQAEALSGLHAKLFITDEGWDASVWTGSANATTAAFSRNIEFLVRLTGKKSRFGVEAFLADDKKGGPRFISLLQAFVPGDQAPEVDPDRVKAEKLAEKTRDLLGDLRLRAVVSPAAEAEASYYSMRIEPDEGIKPRRVDPAVRVTCWPVNLPERDASDAAALLGGGTVEFPRLSFEGLTSFLGFHITAQAGGQTHDIRFVQNIPVEGMPADRAERMLRLILNNRGKVLRLLLLLLAESGGDLLPGLMRAQGRDAGEGDNGGLKDLGDQALLEPLLKTLESNPAQLDRIARLVKELEVKPGEEDLLPPGFRSVWEPIWEVAQGLRHEVRTP